MPKKINPTLHSVSFYTLQRTFSRTDVPLDGSVQDMCRYDMAYVPLDGRALVAFPRFKMGHRGVVGGHPTERRWASFCIRINPTDERPADWIDGAPFEPSDWVTFRHPSFANGGTNYSSESLEQVSLKRFLSEPVE